MKQHNAEQVVAALKRKQGERSIRCFAVELGVSAAYLSGIYSGKREPGKSVLRNLGLERRSVYIESRAVRPPRRKHNAVA